MHDPCEKVIEVSAVLGEYTRVQIQMLEEMRLLREKVDSGLLFNNVTSLATIGLMIITIVIFVASFYTTLSDMRDNTASQKMKQEQIIKVLIKEGLWDPKE